MICNYCNSEVENNKTVKFISTKGNKKCICDNCKENLDINLSVCELCHKCYEYNYVKNSYDVGYESLCHECYLKEHIDGSIDYPQLGWGYKPDPIFFGGERNEGYNKLFLGIELETDDGEDKDKIKTLKPFLNKSLSPQIGYGLFWGKEDGSLGDYGVEIVSHPATLDFHKTTDLWKKMLNKVISVGLKSNDCDNCGIHIHMNRNYLQTEEINKLDALVNLYSRVFRRFARRNSREYAIYNPNKNQNNLGRNNNHNSRYSCLNFHNENTIEWRIFKGNTKYESIMALFELIQGCCDFVKQPHITIEFIYGDKNICKHALKKFLEEQNFEYLPAYTEMCRVWRDLEPIENNNQE